MASYLEKQFNRTNISIKDLEQTIKYLERLNKIPVDSDDFSVRSALLIAAIISYSRPFSNNSEHDLATGKQKFTGKEVKNLKKEIGESVITYHDKILNLRNTAIAHSEYINNPTQRVNEYSTGNGFLIKSRSFDILSVDLNTSIFLKLTEQVKKIFENKLSDLHKKIQGYEIDIK